jgi:hypothetical protein
VLLPQQLVLPQEQLVLPLAQAQLLALRHPSVGQGDQQLLRRLLPPRLERLTL